MHRTDLLGAILAAPPAAGELLYIARLGNGYTCRRIPAGATLAPPANADEAEAWIYYGGPLPVDDPSRCAAVLDDLLAELESMTGGIDRCRWPLDQPWPHGH